MYPESKEYFKRKNRYIYVMKLKKTKPYGEFNYNNYAYDILCYIVKKKTKFDIDEYLKINFFDIYGIKIKWDKPNGQPYGGFGLSIRLKDIDKLENLIIFLKRINYEPILGYVDFGKGYKNYNFIGHSGSGGQFIYLSIDKHIFFASVSCGNPDTKPYDKQFTFNDVKKIMDNFKIKEIKKN